jgi:curved DNA-binding protein
MDTAEIQQLLGVSPESSERDIRRAYKKLLNRYHPDHATGADAESRFKSILAAYAEFKSGVTSDLARRQGRSTPKTPFDRETRVKISPEQALAGGELVVSVNEAAEELSDLAGPVLVRVRFPSGIRQGEKLRVKGALSDGQGDLYLTMDIQADPRFRTVGSDLYFTLNLAPWEAVLGCLVEVPTLEGTAHVEVKPATTTGQQLRLKGRGLAQPTGNRGNLVCVVEIHVPVKVDAGTQALYRQLAERSVFNPRA